MGRYYGRKPYISSHDDYISFKKATTTAEIRSVAGNFPSIAMKKPYNDAHANYSEMLHYFDGIKNLNISRKEGLYVSDEVLAQAPYVISVVPYVPTASVIPATVTGFTGYGYYSLNGSDWTFIGSLYNSFALGCAYLYSGYGAGVDLTKLYFDDFQYILPVAMQVWNDNFTGSDHDPPNVSLWESAYAEIISNTLTGASTPNFMCESKGSTVYSSTLTVKSYIHSTVGNYAYSCFVFGPPGGIIIDGEGFYRLSLVNNSIAVIHFLESDGIRTVSVNKQETGGWTAIASVTLAPDDNTVYLKIVWM